MSKTVLLARPHPFIVAEMKPLLEQSGYASTKLERLTNLPTLDREATGAVISLALVSSITEPAEEVLAKLPVAHPTSPCCSWPCWN